GKARLVAQRFGTEHHELRLQPDIVDLFPAVVESFDEPFADDAAIPTYLVSQLAAADVKVALAGEGGDELFGGYDVYTAHALARGAAARARPVRPRAALRPRRCAAGARAAPRLEADVHPGGPRRPAARARRRSARPLPLALGRERARGRPRARLRPRRRHVPRGRAAREGRPREHGALAR